MTGAPQMTRDLHDKWKAKYRTPENYAFYDIAYDAIHRHLGATTGMVLDAGCGTGEKTVRLESLGHKVVAVDFSPAALEEAAGTVARAGHAARIVRGDLTSLPFADATFEAIVIWGVLMHVPDVARAVAELCRVLRPGGRIAVYDVHASSLDVLLLRAAKRLTGRGTNTRTKFGIENWVTSQGGPVLVRWFSDAALRDLFAAHGVTLERVRAGRFTELFVYVGASALRRLLHAWNIAYFKFIRWPAPSYAIIALGRKHERTPAGRVPGAA